jgi:sulfite exporter TauE/SafE
METDLMDALILGLSSGASCLASCAPFIAPAIATESDAPRLRRFSLVGIFLAGRLISYLAVGAAVGALGSLAAGFLSPSVDRLLLRTGWALGGLVLLAGGLAQFKNHALCARIASHEKAALSVFVLGVAAGLNLCPPFIAAASRAVSLDALGGALYFALFFVGTSAWALLFAIAPAFKRKATEIKAVARITMLMLGLYFLVVLGIFGWS